MYQLFHFRCTRVLRNNHTKIKFKNYDEIDELIASITNLSEKSSVEDLDNILNEMITMSDYKNRGQQYEALKKLFGGGGSFNKKQMLNAFINESDKLLKNMPNNNPLPQELIILKQAMWSSVMTWFEKMLLDSSDEYIQVEKPKGKFYNGRKLGVVI